MLLLILKLKLFPFLLQAEKRAVIMTIAMRAKWRMPCLFVCFIMYIIICLIPHAKLHYFVGNACLEKKSRRFTILRPLLSNEKSIPLNEEYHISVIWYIYIKN